MQAQNSDDFDVDAEIARELAVLREQPSSLQQATAYTPAAEQCAVYDGNDSDGTEEPESLKALRAAFAAREQFANKLTDTLEESRLLEAPPQQRRDAVSDSQDVAEAVAVFTLLSGSCTSLENEKSLGPVVSDALAVGCIAGPTPGQVAAEQTCTAEHAGQADGATCELRHDLAVGISQPADSAAAKEPTVATGPPATAIDATNPQQAANVVLQEQQNPAAGSNWRSTVPAVLARDLATAGTIAVTAAAACEHGAGCTAVTHHDPADGHHDSSIVQQHGPKEPGSGGLQQLGDAWRPAAAAVADTIAAERALAEAAQQQLVAQGAALQKLLQQQAAAAVAREAASQALRQQLDQQRVEAAARFMSAWRIARAWQTYRHSSAFAARHVAITALQAAIRCAAARRLLAELKQRRHVLVELQDALRSGQKEASLAAQQKASEAGYGSDAEQLVRANQSAQSAAVQQLQQAAVAGNHAAFAAALSAAEEVGGLQADITAARQRFDNRKAAAEQVLRVAVEALPLPQVQCAVDAALQLGVNAKQLANSFEAARARDAAAITRLSTAVRAAAAVAQRSVLAAGHCTTIATAAAAAVDAHIPEESKQEFDLGEFDAAVAVCQQLGKTSEAAAAKQALQQHRQLAAAQLHLASEQCTSAAGVDEVMMLCKSLGSIEQKIEKAVARVQQRREGLMEQIQQHLSQLTAASQSTGPAADISSIHTQLQQLLKQAEQLGVHQAVEAAKQLVQTWQVTAVEGLQQAAVAGSVHQLQLAMTRARQWQVDEQTLQETQQQMQQCRVLAAEQLAAIAGECCRVLLSGGTSGCELQVLQIVQQWLAMNKADTAAQLLSRVSTAIAAAEASGPLHLQDLLQQLGHQIEQCGKLGLHMNAVFAVKAVEQACKEALHAGHSIVASAEVQLDCGGIANHCLSSQRSSNHCGSNTATAGALLTEESWCCDTACTADGPVADAAVTDEQQDPSCFGATQNQQQHQQQLPNLCVATGPAGLCSAEAVATCSKPATAASAAQIALLQQQWADNLLQAADFKHSAAISSSSYAKQTTVLPVASASQRKQAVAVPPAQQSLQLQRVLCANAAVAVGQLYELRRLDLSLEQLGTLQGLGQLCPQLQVLAVNMNKLSDLVGLQECQELQQLAAKDNVIAHWPDISHHPQLHSLQLDNNKIRHLTFLDSSSSVEGTGRGDRCIQQQQVQHTDLQLLSLANNQVTSLLFHPPSATAPVTEANGCSHPSSSISGVLSAVVCGLSPYLPSLQVLRLPGNQLSDLAGLEGCGALRQLDVSRNRLTSLQGLVGCHLLQQLCASGNCLSTFAQSLHLPLLQQLDLSSNRFSSWPGLPPLAHLQHLNLSDNQISGAIPCLAGYEQLEVLDLGFNQLSQLRQNVAGIAAAGALRELQLHDNRFRQEDRVGGVRAGVRQQQQGQQGQGEEEEDGPGSSWYRQYVMSAIPWLQLLDRDPVYSIQQRQQQHGRALAAAAGAAGAAADDEGLHDGAGELALQMALAMGRYVSRRTDLSLKLMRQLRSGSVRSSALGAPLQNSNTGAACGSSSEGGGSGSGSISVPMTGVCCRDAVLSAAGCWLPCLLAEQSPSSTAQQQLLLPGSLHGQQTQQQQEHQQQQQTIKALPCQHLQQAVGMTGCMQLNEHNLQPTSSSSSNGSDWLEEVDLHWCFTTRANLVWQQSQQQQQQQQQLLVQVARRRAASTVQQYDVADAAVMQLAQQHLMELTQQPCSLHQDQLQQHQQYHQQQQTVVTAAAELLQCSWRGRAARLLYKQELLQFRELQDATAAAVVLQCCWRCCCARKLLRALQQQQQQQQLAEGDAARNAAATRIQAAVRGHRVRSRLKSALAAAVAGSSSSSRAAKLGAAVGSSSRSNTVGGLGDSTDWDEFAGVPDDYVTMPADLLQELTQQQQQQHTGVLNTAGTSPGVAALALHKVLATASSSSFGVSSTAIVAAAPTAAAAPAGSTAGQTNTTTRIPAAAAASAAEDLQDSPSECMSAAAAASGSIAAAAARQYEAKLQQLMSEWRFTDRATAEAYYKRIKHNTKAAAMHKLQQQMRDPNARLHRLQEQLQTAPPVAAACSFNGSRGSKKPAAAVKGALRQVVSSSRITSGSSHSSGSHNGSASRASSETADVTSSSAWALPVGAQYHQQQQQQQQGQNVEDDGISVHSFSTQVSAAGGSSSSGSSSGSGRFREHFTAGPPPAAGSLRHSSSGGSNKQLQMTLSSLSVSAKNMGALPGIAAPGGQCNGKSSSFNSGCSSSSSTRHLRLPVLPPVGCSGPVAGAAAVDGFKATEQHQQNSRQLPQLRHG